MKETGVDGSESAVIEKSKGSAQPAPAGVDKLKGKKCLQRQRKDKGNSRAGQLVQAWRSQEAAFLCADNKMACV